jgi:hypothetical protein
LIQFHHSRLHSVSRAYPTSRIGPDTELKTSSSAPTGSEDHYFSDTVAPSQTDLLDLDYRYGQTPTPHYRARSAVSLLTLWAVHRPPRQRAVTSASNYPPPARAWRGPCQCLRRRELAWRLMGVFSPHQFFACGHPCWCLAISPALRRIADAALGALARLAWRAVIHLQPRWVKRYFVGS